MDKMQRLLTGAGVRVYVNDRPFAEVAGLDYQSNTPKKKIFGLDRVWPYELAPTVCMGSGVIKIYRLPNKGGFEGAGMSTHYVDLPKEKYFSITIMDVMNKKIIFQATKCSATSQNFSFNPKQLCIGSLSFDFIDWSNEIPPTADMPK